MVITFPQMGNITLAAKSFFEDIGIPCVPPENNKTALQAGARVSPDEMCLPFKMMMGNYMEAIRRGADTILITGSCGPCRFGEYCELQRDILHRKGLRADMIVVDAPREIGTGELLHRLGRIGGASSQSTPRILLALRAAMRVLKAADALDKAAGRIAGMEQERGSSARIIMRCRREALRRTGSTQTLAALKEGQRRLRELPLDPARQPLHIALVGEIYSMIEPYANLYIEEKLMAYGACSKRLITPDWWVKDLAFKPLKGAAPGQRAAKPYLPYAVGGHARETLAHAERCAKCGFDGAIQIFPTGCMPEIVAASVLPELSKRRDFPVLKLVMDEITGEAGVVTRIEAFLDMLEAKRRRGLALQSGH